MSDVEEIWNDNARARAEELANRTDQTYWGLLVPMFEYLVGEITTKERILDVGCGLGFLTNRMTPFAKFVAGVDISKNSLDYARKNFPQVNEWAHSSIVKYQAGHEKSFDVCIANMVFHYFDNLDENLKAIGKLLKDGGFLIFAVPHPYFWYANKRFDGKEQFNFLPDYYVEKSFHVPFRINNGHALPHKIVYRHRTLETYIRALYENDFAPLKMREVSLRRDGDPDILFYQCHKIY